MSCRETVRGLLELDFGVGMWVVGTSSSPDVGMHRMHDYVYNYS